MGTGAANADRLPLEETDFEDAPDESLLPLPMEETDEVDPAPLGFILFIATNGVLFIRPAEIVTELIGLPIYEVMIILSLVCSLPAIFQWLRDHSLMEQPIHLCVFGLLPALVLSHLTHAMFGASLNAFWLYFKILIYYVQLVSLLTSLRRFRVFFFWLVMFVIVLTVLALLQYHEIIDFPALRAKLLEYQVDDATGFTHVLVRLRSTGIYNDPNDLCLILVIAMSACLYFITDRTAGTARWAWLLPLLLFAYALALTKSRGGLFALLAGVMILFWSRFGWWKSILLSAAVMPVLLVFFAGRQTQLNLDDREGSEQARIALWREGWEMFKQAPAFGVGQGEYMENAGQVAHNSFIHCFAELGFFGGTLFTGAWFVALTGLFRASAAYRKILSPELLRLSPYLFTAVAAYVVGMLTLSRSYIVPTYMVLGLGAAYLGVLGRHNLLFMPRLGPRLAGTMVVVSILVLVVVNIFLRIWPK
jgi:O-antigen ligase